MIKTTGKEKDYELIEYILNVNTQYTQVLMELNENGAMDAVYTYGVSRLTEDRFTGESNFYLYDPAGNVAGITDQNGYLWQSYRYDAFGNATFGSPQYDNEYTFNAESYNPNIRSQYLRARYYDMVKGNFLTEDSYLGDIRKPLTLNRYSYCIGNPLFYSDPSGHLLYHYEVTENVERQIEEDFLKDTKNSRLHEYQRYELYEERINAYEGLNYTGFWDAPWFSKEEQRISYMVGLDYGNSKHRRFIKLAAETAKNMTEAKRCLEENRITTISEQYVQFLFAYVIGSSDKWAYANDLGDGVVTIAGGVVIKGKGETYPLGEDVYENYMKRKENNDPLSIQEAHKLTIDRMEDFIKGLNDKVKEKG